MAALTRGAATRITGTGKVHSLDLRAEPDDIVHPDAAGDPQKLARLLTGVLASVNVLRKRFAPRRVDFEDQLCTTANTLRLAHGFGGRVRWWIIDWTSTGTPLVDSNGDTVRVYAPMLVKTSASDANTLVLQSYISGTATIRIEEAG